MNFCPVVASGVAANHAAWGPQLVGLCGTDVPNQSDGEMRDGEGDAEVFGNGIQACAFDNRGVGRSSMPEDKKHYRWSCHNTLNAILLCQTDHCSYPPVEIRWLRRWLIWKLLEINFWYEIGTEGLRSFQVKLINTCCTRVVCDEALKECSIIYILWRYRAREDVPVDNLWPSFDRMCNLHNHHLIWYTVDKLRAVLWWLAMQWTVSRKACRISWPWLKERFSLVTMNFWYLIWRPAYMELLYTVRDFLLTQPYFAVRQSWPGMLWHWWIILDGKEPMSLVILWVLFSPALIFSFAKCTLFPLDSCWCWINRGVSLRYQMKIGWLSEFLLNV